MPRVFQCQSAIADATARRSVAYLGYPNCKRADGLHYPLRDVTELSDSSSFMVYLVRSCLW